MSVSANDMSTVSYSFDANFEVELPLLIVGAGAAGLCAALAATEAGIEVFVDRARRRAGRLDGAVGGLVPPRQRGSSAPRGSSTARNSLPPNIQRKAKGEADAAVVDAVAHGAGVLVEWLMDRYGLPFDLVDNFNYPGHAVMRMHGLPTRTGSELIDRLRQPRRPAISPSCRSALPMCCWPTPTAVSAAWRFCAVTAGASASAAKLSSLPATALAAIQDLVRRFIPEMGGALYFGSSGKSRRRRDVGRTLGAELAHLGAYQGHGSVATPHNILITWAVIMQGGIQVNRDGSRFCDETQGYSEQAAEVLRQPGAIAWSVFDARIAAVARQFEDFQNAERAGAILTGRSVEELAGLMRVPAATFASEWADVESFKAKRGTDRYGRQFAPEQLCVAPFHAVKVTGALFHTQGGLAVDGVGRVRRQDGTLLPNLFAAGGAAAGVSGTRAAGYLSGNGLLTATVLGRLAGLAAAGLSS